MHANRAISQPSEPEVTADTALVLISCAVADLTLLDTAEVLLQERDARMTWLVRFSDGEKAVEVSCFQYRHAGVYCDLSPGAGYSLPCCCTYVSAVHVGRCRCYKCVGRWL